jgi:23S rRNA (cytosine1962-C5)-methyltransferase
MEFHQPSGPAKDLPLIRLLPSRHKRVRGGHPWVYSNEIAMDEAAKKLPLGSLVRLQAANGEPLGLAMFNPHTLIAARMLARDDATCIDQAFLEAKLRAALELRERLYPGGYYRLIHAEADGLPGVIVDRYGALVVVQPNTAGIARLLPELLAALDAVIDPTTVVLRGDTAARKLEGLEDEVRVTKGALDGLSELVENDARFVVDLSGGQKTGWFYDQRENRAAVARRAKDARVLDTYAYAGGFAVTAALAGAREVIAIDRSQAALDLAAESARRNQVAARCSFRRAEAFEELERMDAAGERFDVVVADPPAFVKSRKDLQAGARGYRKLARLAGALVSPRGFLFMASCSHNLDRAGFDEMVALGLRDIGRSGRILRSSGAGADHPVHPMLPESAYLKGSLLQLD